MIKLSGIDKSFGTKTVLRGFDLEVAPGERVCLTGSSGCGKSTVLAIASGTLAPDAGEVRICENVRMAYLYQDDRLLPWLDALENVAVTGVPQDRAVEMLTLMGLGEDIRKRPGQLSGGMRRRLAIARALAYGGDIFYLDEPLQGLDGDTAERVTGVMLDSLRGRTVLMVSHNDAEIEALATRVVHMDAREDAR